MSQIRHTAASRRPIGLLVLLLTAIGASALTAQQQITFFLAARTPGGEFVSDLRADEIGVDEDGRAAKIVNVVPVTWPVKVTVLVDNGANTAPLLVHYRNGLKAFFGDLPPGIESSLLTLAPQPRWVVRPTGDRDALVKGVDRIAPDDTAPRFIDGLIEVANRIEQENSKQTTYFPVIVMLSTTGLEGSGAPGRRVDRMAGQLLKYAARLHVIMVSVSATSPSVILGAAQVQIGKTLADGTGGRYEGIAAATRITTLLPEYARVIGDAHTFQSHQYKVTAARPEGATGVPGLLSTVPTRPGLRFTATAQGLQP
jgi:hypothetical protein